MQLGQSSLHRPPFATHFEPVKFLRNGQYIRQNYHSLQSSESAIEADVRRFLSHWPKALLAGKKTTIFMHLIECQTELVFRA